MLDSGIDNGGCRWHMVQRNNNKKKERGNGEGWRRDEEDSEGEGKSGATTGIIIF